MKLTILGCYSATPRTFNNPTAQVLEIRGRLFLIDCGEGTQVQLRKHKVKFARIKHIFISHLHGDHFFGLPGLISTFRLLGREEPLHIYGPKGIKEAITLFLKLGDSWTNFPLLFHELSSKEQELIFEDDKVEVRTLPLDHRVYTNGFLFTEKPKERKLNVDATKKYGIEICYYQNIKNGKDVVLEDGTVVKNELLSFNPPPVKSYAFCSDTAYKPALVPLLKGVDVLYHEATFLDQHEHLAPKTKHSTAKQAALIAKDAQVKQLILGHFSTRYDNMNRFKEEAQTVFEAVDIADDGKEFTFS
jgi:ribonuclease Z